MGTANINHPKTIHVDYCWVCKSKFTDSGGKAIRHEHHIIPRAYGGADGPTVTLCNTHHDKLHRVAEKLIADKNPYAFFVGETKESIRLILYLANIVRNSATLVKNDPNKHASVMVTLTRNQQNMVDKLKHIYPSSRSRASILALALQSLYNKHFTD